MIRHTQRYTRTYTLVPCTTLFRAQRVPVVQRAQAEVIEVAVERGVDGVVERARAGLHEAEQALVDQADFMPARNRLRERVDLLPGDLLGDHELGRAHG